MAQRDVNFIIRARDDASKAFRAIDAALDRLAASQSEVETGSAGMSAALARSKHAATGLAADLGGETAAAARATEIAFQRIEEAVDRATARLRGQEGGLRETEARYESLVAQLRAAEHAIVETAIALRKSGDSGLEEKLRGAQVAYQQLQREAQRTAQSIQAQQASVRESTTELGRLEGQATAAQAALRNLGRTDIDGRGNIAATAAAQARLAAAYRQSAAAARPARVTIRDVVRELLRLPPAADAAARSMIGAGRASFNMRRALAAFYGDSRRALSLMQRLRGEVLSLTASMVGFYAIFESGRSVYEAFGQLEAAINRFGAAFDQNMAAAGREIAYVEGEARRLGFAFDALASGYSNFLISAQAANIETDETRRIFQAVTETARVMRLSTDQVGGVLTALTQIAGKGTLQMEELRQQLGDRIPGAVGIMAAGLGYASDELDQFYRDVENGAISSDRALSAFADELENRFGDQLPQALNTVTAEMGRFQDALFQRRLTAGNAGFIDGLRDALAALSDWLNSNEGIEFFEALGAAAGRFLQIIPGMIDALDQVIWLFEAFVAIKIAQFLRGLAASFATFTGSTVPAMRAMVRLRQSVAYYTPALAAAARGNTIFAGTLSALRGPAIAAATAVRGLWLAIGGLPGLIITAVSFLAVDMFGDTLTAVSALDSALSSHRDSVDEIRRAYLRAADGADDWRESLEGVTELSLQNDRRLLEAAARDARAIGLGLNQATDPDSRREDTNRRLFERLRSRAGTGAQLAEIDDLEAATRAFEEGGLSAAEFERAVLEASAALGEVEDREIQRLLSTMVDAAEAARVNEEALVENEAALRAVRGEASEADEVLLGLRDGFDDAGGAASEAATQYGAFADALEELAGHIPELQRQLDRFTGIAEIESDFQAALRAANALPEAIMRIAAAQEALDTRDGALAAFFQVEVDGAFGNYTDGVEAAMAVLREFEGFSATPYNDPATDGNGDQVGPDIYRAGYGSNTVTLSDGTIREITQGMRVSVEEAALDLERRVRTEFAPTARNQTGAERFDSFSAQQQAALISIAYNYGSLPDRILGAVREGTNEEIAAAIRSLQNDNGGVNRNRRFREAALFASGASEEAVARETLQELERRREEEEAAAEARQEFNDGIAESNAQRQFELELQDMDLVNREVARALREAELEAQEAGTELTAQQRADIEATVRALHAREGAEEARNQRLEEARRLEEEVNRLQERRAFLTEQLAYYQSQGDAEGVASTQEELDEINTALEDAIANAIAFWEALGGEDSLAAIQALQQTQAELGRVAQTAVVTGEQVNNMIADRMTSAIDRFSQRVAAGENAWQVFKEEALRAIGEVMIQLAQLILRQAILNAISGGTMGGGLGGTIAGGVNGLFRHSGGLVDGTGRTGSVHPAYFANAVRYHNGGIAGLQPNEVPAILEEGEEVLTETDPRHRSNMRGGSGGSGGMKVINAIDGTDALDAALSSSDGEEVLLNYIRANRETVKAALG